MTTKYLGKSLFLFFPLGSILSIPLKSELNQNRILRHGKKLFRSYRASTGRPCGAISIESCKNGASTMLRKALQICKTLGWAGYPERGEFKYYESFRVHSLDVLLHLSGIEQKVKTHHLADWSEVVKWDPEARYKPIGTTSQVEAGNMVEASRRLLSVL